MSIAYDDPSDNPEYQEFIDKLAMLCACEGIDKPCDGLLAGGLCDNFKSLPSDE